MHRHVFSPVKIYMAWDCLLHESTVKRSKWINQALQASRIKETEEKQQQRAHRKNTAHWRCVFASCSPELDSMFPAWFSFSACFCMVYDTPIRFFLHTRHFCSVSLILWACSVCFVKFNLFTALSCKRQWDLFSVCAHTFWYLECLPTQNSEVRQPRQFLLGFLGQKTFHSTKCSKPIRIIPSPSEYLQPRLENYLCMFSSCKHWANYH